MAAPVKGVGQTPLVSPNLNHSVNGGGTDQKEIENVTKGVAQPVLQKPAVQASGWGILNWINWSGSQGEENVSTVVSRQEEGTQQTMGEAEEGPKEEQPPSTHELPQESPQNVNQPPLAVEELKIPEAKVVPAAVPAPVVEKKERFEQTTMKTEQASQGWWAYLQQTTLGAKVQQYATVGTQYVLNRYANTLNKSKLLRQAEETMSDPQFIEFFRTVHAVVAQKATTQINELGEGFIAQNARGQQELIQDLLEVNVARGFANLARQMHAQSHSIPNYDQQPLLVSLLSFLSQKIGPNLNLQQFATIEAKYRENRMTLERLLQQHFKAEELESKQKLVQQYIQANTIENKANLFKQLFPDYDNKQGAELERIQKIEIQLTALIQKHQDLKAIFDQVADNIVLCLFPNKLADLEIPSLGVLQYSFIQNFIYNQIQGFITDFLQTSYEPLENDLPRVQQWENALKGRSGVNDLQPILQAPTAFLVGFTKNFIQSNPKAIELTAKGLSSIHNPESQQDEHASLLAQSSQGPLAGWIVESIQALLHTQDPHLLGLGRFAEGVFSRLTLALMAKGATLAIPEGEKIDPKQFLKELVDRLIHQVKDLPNQEISEGFWKDFIKDLPLPPALKDLLVPLLIEQAQELQKSLKTVNPALEEIEKVYQETNDQLEKYNSGGQELLSIVETISDRFMDLALDEEMGLISTLGLEETLEEVCDQYLPGIKLDNELKEWFSSNISALKAQKGQQTPESIALIEKSIQVILRKALITKIEKNFKNDGDDHIAQLLQDMREPFAKAFKNFNSTDRQKINAALAFQAEIQTKTAKIEELKQQVSKKPEGVTEAQLTLFQEVITANNRVLRASRDQDSLMKRLQGKLEKLNESFEEHPWSVEQLEVVRQAVALHKILIATHRTKEGCKGYLTIEIMKLLPLAAVNQASRQQLNQYQTLITLLDMSVEELQLMTKALHIEATLKRAQKEIDLLNQELFKKKVAVGYEDAKSLDNRSQWDAGKLWLNQVIENRQAVKQIENEVKDLQAKLDANLAVFQTVVQEFSALIGLDQKDKLQLPDYLRDKIWPYIESAKNEQLARLLFEHVTPLLLPGFDSDKNRQKLEALSGNKTFWDQDIPNSVTSYKFFAEQILQTIGIEKPSPVEISKMETALQQTVIQLGRIDVKASMLQQAVIKGLIAAEQEVVFSEALEKLVAQSQTTEYKKEQVLSLLLALSSPTLTTEEKEKLSQLAQLIAENLNQFLFNHGKLQLTSKDLLNAYQGQLNLDSTLIEAEKISDENRQKLEILLSHKSFLGQVAQVAAKELIQHIPDFVTSYKPFAEQILQAIGIKNPSDIEISRMEKAVQQTVIQLGKADVKASMLKPVIKGLIASEQEVAFSEALEQLVAQPQTTEYKKEQVFPLLRALSFQTLTQEEEKKLSQLAQLIAKNLNQFLFNHGKTKLTSEDLLKAYQGQLSLDQAMIIAEKIEETLKTLDEAQLVEKIQAVVLTPEEVAQTLNDVIPGAKDLHTLIAPQLQAAIVGKDVRFQESREVLKYYVEGMILRFLVKIAETNTEARQGILAVITRKLKELPPQNNALRNKTAEEVARDMIDQVLEEILGITSKDDLEGIPLPLKQLVYDKIKEIAYEQLAPLMLPIIEREKDCQKLETLSGSKFLGALTKKLSSDIFDLLPLASKSYSAIAGDLWTLLTKQAPTEDQLAQFTQEIEELVQKAKDKNITNRALVKAYARVAGIKLTHQEKIDLRAQLAERQAKQEIRNVLMTPEEIVLAITEDIPGLDNNLKQAFADELQGLIHRDPASYQNLSAFVNSYVEGILLKFFAGVAKKNPSQAGKDTLVIVTEKLLALVTSKYQQAKDRAVDEVARELNDELMHDILGIDSPEALVGLPAALQKVVFNKIKDQLGEFLIRLHQSLQTLDSQDPRVQQAQEGMKRFGVEENTKQAYFTILTNDLAQMVVDSVPQVLAQKVGGENAIKGATSIAKSTQMYLEELARGNIRVAQALLGYAQAPQFQEILGNQLTQLHESEAIVEDKKKAADMVSNLLLVPLNRVLQTAIDFEEKKGEAFTQHLMAKILHVGAGHLAHLNAAKKAAALDRRTHILHQDFMAATGDSLHPAVPTSPITYQEIVDEINKRLGSTLDDDQREEVRQAIVKLAQQEMQGAKLITLTDIVDAVEKVHLKAKEKLLTRQQKKDLVRPDEDKLTLKDFIRQEMESHVAQRQKYAYDPAIKEVIKLLFPNGKKDLVEVPVELRSQVWKMYKQNLFPLVLPMLTELILDPDIITTMVLSSLETTRDSLNEKIVLSTPEPEGLPLDELDEVSGELMAEVMKMVELPAWAKKIVIDPQGNVYDSMKKTIGATLRSQFKSNFILDKLKVGLESAVRRDPQTGEYSIKYDKRPQAEKTADAKVKRKQKEEQLIKVSHEAVDASISYFIRNKWVQAQARFDEIVRKVFGKVGAALKRALDLLFRVIFFKIIGNILAFLTIPLKGLVKQKIYNVISLDKNRDQIMEMLRRVPEDQPTADEHVVYNEDLVYKMCEALKEAVVDFVDQPLSVVTPGETPGEPDVIEAETPGKVE